MNIDTFIYENITDNTNNMELSTFYPCSIQYENKEYSTAEHLFQSLRYLSSSQKVDKEYAEVIRQVRTPYAARLLGDQYVIHANMNWVNEIAQIMKSFQMKGLRSVSYNLETYELMKFSVRQKLIQYPKITDILSKFQGKIVYHSRYNSYWGFKEECVYNLGSPNAWYEWTGLNQYGKILTELREEISELTT